MTFLSKETFQTGDAWLGDGGGAGSWTGAVYAPLGLRDDERPIPTTDAGNWNIVAGPRDTWPASVADDTEFNALFGTLGEVVAAGADYVGLNGVDALGGVGSISAFLAGQPQYTDYHAMYTRILNGQNGLSENPIIYGIYRDAAFTDPVWEGSYDWTFTHVPQPYPLSVNATGLVGLLGDMNDGSVAPRPDTLDIDWGDGGGVVTEDMLAGNYQVAHTYAAAGIYHVVTKTPDPFYLDNTDDVHVLGQTHVAPATFAAAGSASITFTVTADAPLDVGDRVQVTDDTSSLNGTFDATPNGSGGLTFNLPLDATAGAVVYFVAFAVDGSQGDSMNITPT